AACGVPREGGHPGEPVTRMRPRALMVPPGFPDFMTRVRVVDVGEHEVRGRAWSGGGAVTSVEGSSDDARNRLNAEVEPATSRWAWQGWRFRWDAAGPGRAT